MGRGVREQLGAGTWIERGAFAAAGRRQRPAIAAWLPVVLLGAGALLGLALWVKWGFAIAFEAIRTCCFQAARADACVLVRLGPDPG
jgi:hypothetical protein